MLPPLFGFGNTKHNSLGQAGKHEDAFREPRQIDIVAKHSNKAGSKISFPSAPIRDIACGRFHALILFGINDFFSVFSIACGY